MTDFFRFPHTPHLAWLGEGSPRDDKVLSPADVGALLTGNVVVEEKLDGANIGFSLAANGSLRAQNRGQYLTKPYTGQFARLPAWLAQHEEGLQAVLQTNLKTTPAALKQMVSQQISHYREGPVEGVVVRRESTDWCEFRAKLVRPDFTQAINTHWRKRKIEWNQTVDQSSTRK